MSEQYVKRQLAKIELELKNSRATKAELSKITPEMQRQEVLKPIETDFLISRDAKISAGYDPDKLEPEPDEVVVDIEQYKQDNYGTYTDFRDNLLAEDGSISRVKIGSLVREFRRLGIINDDKLRELRPIIADSYINNDYTDLINLFVNLYNDRVDNQSVRKEDENTQKLERYRKRLENTYLGKFNTQQLPNESDQEFYYRIQSYKDQLPTAEQAIQDEMNTNIKILKSNLSKILKTDEVELIINDKNIVNDATLLFINSTWKAFYNYIKTTYTSISVNEFKLLLQEYAESRILPNLTTSKKKPEIPIAELFKIPLSREPSVNKSKPKPNIKTKTGYKYKNPKIRFASKKNIRTDNPYIQFEDDVPDDMGGVGEAKFASVPFSPEMIQNQEEQLRLMKEIKKLEKAEENKKKAEEKAERKAENDYQRRLKAQYKAEQKAAGRYGRDVNVPEAEEEEEAEKALAKAEDDNNINDIIEELTALNNADLVKGIKSAYAYFKDNNIEPEAIKEFSGIMREMRGDKSLSRKDIQNVLIGGFAPILKSARDSLGTTNVKRMAGLGIKANTKEDFLPFGRVIISMDKLHKNMIKIKYASTGSNHPKLRRQIKISNDFKDLLLDIVERQKFNHRLFKMLDEVEQTICLDLLKVVGLKKTLKIGDLETTIDKELMNEYDIICGEIESGNDNPQLIKRAKQLIAVMIKMNKISRQTGLEMLLCL